MSAVPPPTSRDQFRRLSVLIAVCFVDMIGFAMVFPLIPFYALRFHATPITIGFITAAYSVAQIVAAPLWGRVSDRYGRRPALMIGLAASACAFLVFGLATTIWLLFLSRLIQGAGGGTTGVAQAYVADTMRPSDRARALGWLSAATSAGVSIGPALGSWSSGLGHAAPGLLAAALCVVNVAFAWYWLPESKPTGTEGAAHAAPRSPVWHAARDVLRAPTAPVSRLIWIYSVGMLAFAALTGVLALYLNAEFGVTEKTIGFFFMYVSGISIVMRLFLLGPIVDRLGEVRTVRLGTICLTVGLGAFPLAHSLPVLALVLPLMPIGTALMFPSTTALMSRFSSKGELGTVMGTAQTFAGMSRIVAPVLGTMAFQRLGHGWPFFAAGGVVALVGLLAFHLEQPHAGVTPVPGTPPAGQ